MIGILIPAHNEEALLDDCLRAARIAASCSSGCSTANCAAVAAPKLWPTTWAFSTPNPCRVWAIHSAWSSTERSGSDCTERPASPIGSSACTVRFPIHDGRFSAHIGAPEL